MEWHDSEEEVSARESCNAWRTSREAGMEAGGLERRDMRHPSHGKGDWNA